MDLTSQKLVVKESRRARRKATVNFLMAGCQSIQAPFDPDVHVARLSNDSIVSTPKGFGSIDIRWDFERGIAHVRELPIPGLAGEAMPLEFERRGQ